MSDVTVNRFEKEVLLVYCLVINCTVAMHYNLFGNTEKAPS